MINGLPLYLQNGRVVAVSSSSETYIGRLFYFRLSEDADVPGYKRASTQPPSGVATNLTQSNTGTSDILLATFITDGGQPSVDSIPMGSDRFHIHASTGSTDQQARLKIEVFKRSPLGDETKIREGYSQPFAGSSISEIEWEISDPNAYPIGISDRLVWKLYSARVGGPVSCDVSIYFESPSHAAFAVSTIVEGIGASLAPNTFWGRDSSGFAEPKQISDFSFNLLEQPSDSSWRSNLGLGSMATKNETDVFDGGNF